MNRFEELHNHVTLDIKPKGECPECDRYHEAQDPEAVPHIYTSPDLASLKESLKRHPKAEAFQISRSSAEHLIHRVELSEGRLDDVMSVITRPMMRDAARDRYWEIANLMRGRNRAPEAEGAEESVQASD